MIVTSIWMCALLLGACSGETEEVSEESLNTTDDERLNELDVTEGNTQTFSPTDAELGQERGIEVKVTGDYIEYPVKEQSNKEIIEVHNYSNEFNNYDKLYKEGSYVIHNDYGYTIKNIEEVKYLESNMTNNLFSAEEGHSYLIVQIEIENIGDRDTTINVSPNLRIDDADGKLLAKRENKENPAKYYLEQYGEELVILNRGVERGQVIEYVLAYEISDEIPSGSKMYLSQGDTFGYAGETYKLPIGVIQ